VDTEPSQHLRGRQAIVPCANILGGGSSINFQMYTRGESLRPVLIFVYFLLTLIVLPSNSFRLGLGRLQGTGFSPFLCGARLTDLDLPPRLPDGASRIFSP
jgi:hypothetical protein